ncbi:MAG: cytochrome c biogenesis protein CcdA [Candidatus Saganbacteria bacterium]|nr:cytochrome c biogenesis protein CcdA [Candidatus Saganbacteria bacterium]
MVTNLDFFIAFVAGFLTFFSPCFLPLVPAYLVYITGLSFEELKDVRLKTVVHSLLFILGFSVVFISMGVLVSWLGQFFYNFQNILRVVGGVLIIFLGIYLMGIIKFPFLDQERRFNFSGKPAGYFGSFLVGIVFALGWTPCVGPILGSILIFASQSQTLGRGVGMLIMYCLGLSIPLFLFSLAVNFSLSLLKHLQKYLGTIHFICGLFLVIIGLLLATNYMQALTIWLIDLTGFAGI